MVGSEKLWNLTPQQSPYVYPVLAYCWPTVFGGGPTESQHWDNNFCLLFIFFSHLGNHSPFVDSHRIHVSLTIIHIRKEDILAFESFPYFTLNRYDICESLRLHWYDVISLHILWNCMLSYYIYIAYKGTTIQSPRGGGVGVFEKCWSKLCNTCRVRLKLFISKILQHHPPWKLNGAPPLSYDPRSATSLPLFNFGVCPQPTQRVFRTG